MRRNGVLVLLALFLLPGCVLAADRPIVIDMAALSPGGELRPQVVYDGDSLVQEFVIVNGLPNKYTINGLSTGVDPGPLDISLFELVDTADSVSSMARIMGGNMEVALISAWESAVPDTCRSPGRAVAAALLALNDESKIAGARIALLEAINEETQKNVESQLDQITEEAAIEAGLELHIYKEMVARELKERVNSALEECELDVNKEFAKQTTMPAGTYRLRRNADFTLTIERSDGQGGTVTRTVTVQAQPKGELRRMYGFSFLPSRQEEYFTEAVPNQQNQFRIREKDKDWDDLDFEPTFAFVWHRAEGHTAKKPSFIGGLGLDLKKPMVFAGAQWTFHESIGVFLGAAAYQRTVLDGKYRENQVLPSALDNDQLTVDSYTVGPIVGFAFRLKKNPFAAADDDDDAEEPAAEDPPATEEPEEPADDTDHAEDDDEETDLPPPPPPAMN